MFKQNVQLKDKKVRLWYSPFLRTAQTKERLAKGLGEDLIENYDAEDHTPGWEDDRLREQDFGMFSPIYSKERQFKRYPLEAAHFYNIKDHNGAYWAKAPLGESRADVCLRVGESIDTIMKDAESGKEDVVVVTHGVTMRAFEKRFMHRKVKWFEKEPNPGNCDVVLIETDKNSPHGYKVTKMFKGLKRPNNLPKSYNADPIGGWEVLKEQFEFEQPGQGLVA